MKRLVQLLAAITLIITYIIAGYFIVISIIGPFGIVPATYMTFCSICFIVFITKMVSSYLKNMNE